MFFLPHLTTLPLQLFVQERTAPLEVALQLRERMGVGY